MFIFLPRIIVPDRISFIIFTGIAASNYSHVHQFPCREEYDKYYATMLRVVDIAFVPFAERIQELLIEELTAVSESTLRGERFLLRVLVKAAMRMPFANMHHS